MTGSAGQRRVPANFLSTFDIPLPPLLLQRRIAEVLDKAEALRAKRRAALAQLDSLTQSLFLDLFGEPVANRKCWPLRSFDETMRDETSRSKKLNQSEFSEVGKFPVIDQGQSTVAGYCDDDSMLCVSPLPVVVFGDHTKAVKFVSHPFIIGADGAKVLVPESGIETVFLAALLRMLPIPDLGYSRHMREVKRLKYIAPPARPPTRIRPPRGRRGKAENRPARRVGLPLARPVRGAVVAQRRVALVERRQPPWHGCVMRGEHVSVCAPGLLRRCCRVA
jgi:type I restriction enzyme S subunit